MVLSIGEILADMIAIAPGVFQRFAGGAPFNVACGIRRFGGKVGFIGTVGDDLVGRWLTDFARGQGFDELRLRVDVDRNTTLAFVELDEKGERSFCFYRKNTADAFLDVDCQRSIACADIVHIGSLALSTAEGKGRVDRLFDAAQRLGKPVSFDMNHRADLFPSPELFRPYLQRATLIKLSREELTMLEGDDLEAGARRLAGDRLLAVTLGAEGSAFCHKDVFRVVPSIAVKPVDTTGAGDAFYAGLLTRLDNGRIKTLDDLEQAFRFANVCGALTTTAKGAVSALPSLAEVERRMRD